MMIAPSPKITNIPPSSKTVFFLYGYSSIAVAQPVSSSFVCNPTASRIHALISSMNSISASIFSDLRKISAFCGTLISHMSMKIRN